MTEPTGSRVGGLVKKVAAPVVSRLVNRTAEVVRSELQADGGMPDGNLRATVDELKAEIELLWAELESQRKPPAPF